MDQLLSIVEQIVLPGVLRNLHFFFRKVRLLRLVNFPEQLSERSRHPGFEIWSLPFVHQQGSEVEAHLWHQSLAKFAIFSIEVNDMVRYAKQVLLQVDLINLKHQGGTVRVKQSQCGHLKVVKHACVFHEFIQDIHWREWLICLVKNKFFFQLLLDYIIKHEEVFAFFLLCHF
jgi:hypothetical protein